MARCEKLFLISALFGVFLFSQDLWKDSGEVFSDRKPLPNGSVIHIRFTEGLVASYKAALNQVKTRNNPALNPLPSEFDFLPSPSVTLNKSETGDQSLEIEHSFEGRLAGTITGLDQASGVYRISASQRMNINGQPQDITITAQAYAGDIETDREIDSTKLANLQMNYQGFTVTKSVVEQDFENFSFSTNNTNAIQLSETKKKEYFLEFFKVILDQLF